MAADALVRVLLVVAQLDEDGADDEAHEHGQAQADAHVRVVAHVGVDQKRVREADELIPQRRLRLLPARAACTTCFSSSGMMPASRSRPASPCASVRVLVLVGHVDVLALGVLPLLRLLHLVQREVRGVLPRLQLPEVVRVEPVGQVVERAEVRHLAAGHHEDDVVEHEGELGADGWWMVHTTVMPCPWASSCMEVSTAMAPAAVQAGGGLVEEEQRRLHDELHRDGALLAHLHRHAAEAGAADHDGRRGGRCPAPPARGPPWLVQLRPPSSYEGGGAAH